MFALSFTCIFLTIFHLTESYCHFTSSHFVSLSHLVSDLLRPRLYLFVCKIKNEKSIAFGFWILTCYTKWAVAKTNVLLSLLRGLEKVFRKRKTVYDTMQYFINSYSDIDNKSKKCTHLQEQCS